MGGASARLGLRVAQPARARLAAAAAATRRERRGSKCVLFMGGLQKEKMPVDRWAHEHCTVA
ncbi:hypothetical protein GmRootA79_13710 [Acidovorax sp. A79]